MVSEKDFKQKLKEEMLSKWIDDLNRDKRPAEEPGETDGLNREEREEMHELLDTVRLLKRYKINEHRNSPPVKKNKDTVVTGRNVGIVLVTFVALLLIIVPVVMNSDAAVVHAMEKAINQLEHYEATVLFQFESGGRTLESSKTRLTVGDEGQFRAVTDINGRQLTRVSPGDDLLYTFIGDRDHYVEISYLGTENMEFYRDMFLMKPILDELKEIREIEEIRKEWVNGRETVLYHYRFDSEGPYHQLWVDVNSDLPIQIIHRYENGDRITRSVTELNTELMIIAGDLFTVELDEAVEIHYTSSKAEERMDEHAE